MTGAYQSGGPYQPSDGQSGDPYQPTGAVYQPSGAVYQSSGAARQPSGAAYRQGAAPQRPGVDARRLWAGGLATALVAALIAIVGILLARGLFDVSVLAPKGAGVWGDASTAWYALAAALASLAATGLMHVLLLFTPRPMRFFGWVMALATVAGLLAPFVTAESTASKVYTAGLNLVLGIAIGSLVAGSARSAVHAAARNRNG